MTDKKISELTALGETPASADLFAIVDSSGAITKYVTFANLLAPITVDGTDAACSGAFDVGGVLQLTKGSQNYHFADDSNYLALQGQSSGAPAGLEFFAKDGNGTDDVNISLYGVGTIGSTTNRERLIVGYENSTTQFEIQSEANGTGTLRPLVLYTEGNANQLNLAVDGTVSMSNGLSIGASFQLPKDYAIQWGGSTEGIYVDSGTSGINFKTANTIAGKFDASRRLLVGHTASVDAFGSRLQLHGVDSTTSSFSMNRWQSGADGAFLVFTHSRNATPGTHTIVQDNDTLGYLDFRGSDGVDFANTQARLTAEVDDATPAANAIGGAFTISTATTAGVLTEALRVDSSQITSTMNLYPKTDNTYYLGKNDDDTPLAWKGLIVCDQTTGTYYRIEVDNGVLQATDLTD